MKILQLEITHLEIVKNILKKYPYDFYAFGSRVKASHRALSDLDLIIKEDISLNELAHLEEEFEESDLPFKVDIISWNSCSKEFRQLIEKDMIMVQDKEGLLSAPRTSILNNKDPRI